MDRDNPESPPASPDPEPFDESINEQSASPTQSEEGCISDGENIKSPADVNNTADAAPSLEANNDNDLLDECFFNEKVSDSGPQSPTEEPREDVFNGKKYSSTDNAPQSPDEVQSPDMIGQTAQDIEDLDNFNLEETEEEREEWERLKKEEAEKQRQKDKTSPRKSSEKIIKTAPKTKTSLNESSKKAGHSPDISDKTDPLSSSKTSLHDDHGELDYDEDMHEETTEPESKKEEEFLSDAGDIRKVEKRELSKSVPEEGEQGSDGDDGELDDDDDCEEGEIKEPGTPKKNFARAVCRFYNKGNCTWGNNCRFLHPGVNDKGNYSLIDRNDRPAGIFSRLGPPINGNSWGQDKGPPGESETQRAPSPPQESSWERGLRQAKELMKRANKRKETETNFEEKRLNLSIDEDKDNNKENDRGRFAKDPYYDNSYDDEEDYYSKTLYNSPSHGNYWQGGHYENFEVRWTREPDYPPHRRSPHVSERETLRERMPRERRYSPEMERARPPGHQPSAVFLPRRMSPETERLRYEKRHLEKNNRYGRYDMHENYDRQDYNRPKPYIQERRSERSQKTDKKRRNEREHENRFDRPERREQAERREPTERSERPKGSEEAPVTRRGDEWHDPWIRAKKSPVRKRSTSRSRSRGRRRSYGSRGSSSSSYSSSSGSSRGSRSRSSSYSSYTSRSSSSSSSGSSRSRSRGPKRRNPPPAGLGAKDQRPNAPLKPGETPKSAVSLKGSRGQQSSRAPPPGGTEPRPQPGPNRGPGQIANGPHGPAPPPPRNGPPARGHQPPPGGPKRSPKKPGTIGKVVERGRPRERGQPPMPKRGYSGSSTGSSRSRSFSSSSRSSRSSSSSSSSSSGSADSEHLYRDIASGHSSGSSPSPTRRKDPSKIPAGKKKMSAKGPLGPVRPPPRPLEGQRRGPPEVGPGGPLPEKRNPRVRQDSRGIPEDMPTRRSLPDNRTEMARREREQFPPNKDQFSRDRDMAPKVRDPHPRERDSIRENPNRDKKPDGGRLEKKDDLGHSRPSRPPGEMPRPARPEGNRPRVSQSQSVMQQKSVKQDPLKLSGQKSNIKLTLINKAADRSGQAKKRPAPDMVGGDTAPAPAKRPAQSKPPQPKEGKPVPKSSPATAPRPDKMKPPGPKPKQDDKIQHIPAAAPKRPEPPAPKPVAPPPVAKPKKSASSRREELLKQLKAVEDAIARKRAKLS